MNILHDQNPTTDDENTSFVESESETIEDEVEYIEEYVLKYKLFDVIFSSKKILISLLGLLNIAFSCFFWEVRITHSDVHVGAAFLVTGIALLGSVLLGIIIQHVTMHYLKKTRGTASCCFYVNELSFHISTFIAILSVHIFIFNRYADFCVLKIASIKLYAHRSLCLLMFADFILAILKAAVKYVSMRFNYNTYINSIRKCLLFDFFVALISSIREDEDGERKITVETGDGPLKMLMGRGALNTFILQKRFRIDNAIQLSFAEKRLLIKEFMNLEDRTYVGSLPVVLGKIKDRAESRAVKLVRKLRRQDGIKQIDDISRFFEDEMAFRFLILQLKLKGDEAIEKGRISAIIERSYKDKYVIKRNLEQINSAIERVSFFAELGICATTLAFMFISASIQMDYISGVISWIFGTQFISKILSDGILQSIIFLFVIHPFDIGDRVLIRLGGREENLVVAELNIFSTTFYRFDGTLFLVPNNVMINTYISNIRRSGNIMETHTIQIDSKTAPEKLVAFKAMLVEFCRANPMEFTDYILVNYESIEGSNKLHIKVLMQYKGNFQNYEYYLQRRSKFVCKMNRCLKKLKIKYVLPTQRVRVVEK